jgi:hypothetical protein
MNFTVRSRPTQIGNQIYSEYRVSNVPTFQRSTTPALPKSRFAGGFIGQTPDFLGKQWNSVVVGGH